MLLVQVNSFSLLVLFGFLTWKYFQPHIKFANDKSNTKNTSLPFTQIDLNIFSHKVSHFFSPLNHLRMLQTSSGDGSSHLMQVAFPKDRVFFYTTRV